MDLRFARLYKSFRFKILLSFFALISVILLWVFTYFLINGKQNHIIAFKAKFTALQNRFLEHNRNLEYFVLAGYHQPSFYSTGQQKDIDTFLAEQRKEINDLRRMRAGAQAERINIDDEITTATALNKNLLDSATELKKVYFDKGFQYYGTEGKMWKYAHVLEDSGLIPRVDILQLRRREKDYLLRGDDKYIREHNELTDKLLLKFPPGTTTGNALENYRKYFQLVVAYTDRLGIVTGNGLYNNVQDEINKVEEQYGRVKTRMEAEISSLQQSFHHTLIGISVFLTLLAVILSWNISKFLTKDIKTLNNRMSLFVNAQFREQEDDPGLVKSKITEIDQLNRNFLQLKKTLKTTLAELEEAVVKEKKASEHKSAFVANMSHEIRTPLTGIIGMVHLLNGTKLSEDQQELLDSLDFSANHLQELINMVLDYSKIEAGKMELEHIPFDLKGDITKLLKLFEFKIIEKGLTLRLDYAADFSHYLIGDPLRLQQVLLNLLNNAIKFTPSGGIELRVVPLVARGSVSRLRFEVSDTGIGIAAGEADRLFGAFSQANTSVSRQFGGTGLGLTICNQLVTLMGGKLAVTSEPGKGSVFSFELDFPIGAPIKVRSGREPEKADSGAAGLRILLAEDNPINQKIVSRMLQKYKAVTTFAANGIEAVDLFAKHDYDLILMDLQMPDMDGYEAATTIGSSEKYKVNPVPIVAFSANAYNEDRLKASEAGMDDFLGKPVKPEELEGIIAKYSMKREGVA